MGLKEYLTEDHKTCDQLFANLEKSVQNNEKENIQNYFYEFTKRILRHFKIEEEVLFPLFEEKTKNTMGPTHVMRIEHQDILSQIEEIKTLSFDLNKKNLSKILSILETTLFLLQQHNLKEEQILYTMLERILDNQEEILKEIKNIPV